MKYDFARSFIKDVKKISEDVGDQIKSLVTEVAAADQVGEISNIKKMKGFSNAYRIRVGDYRVGIYLEDNTVIFTRFLHRKEIYRFFP